MSREGEAAAGVGLGIGAELGTTTAVAGTGLAVEFEAGARASATGVGVGLGAPAPPLAAGAYVIVKRSGVSPGSGMIFGRFRDMPAVATGHSAILLVREGGAATFLSFAPPDDEDDRATASFINTTRITDRTSVFYLSDINLDRAEAYIRNLELAVQQHRAGYHLVMHNCTTVVEATLWHGRTPARGIGSGSVVGVLSGLIVPSPNSLLSCLRSRPGTVEILTADARLGSLMDAISSSAKPRARVAVSEEEEDGVVEVRGIPMNPRGLEGILARARAGRGRRIVAEVEAGVVAAGIPNRGARPEDTAFVINNPLRNPALDLASSPAPERKSGAAAEAAEDEGDAGRFGRG